MPAIIAPRIAGVDQRQIQLFGDIDHDARQVAFRQPVLPGQGRQQGLLQRARAKPPVPAGGDGQRMLDTVIDPACHPMDVPRVVAAADLGGVDYFEVELRLTEIGG